MSCIILKFVLSESHRIQPLLYWKIGEMSAKKWVLPGPSDEGSVMEFWKEYTILWPLLPGELSPRVAVPVRIPSMGRIDLFPINNNDNNNNIYKNTK